MLTKPDAKLLTAIIGLGATGNISVVVEFLKAEHERLRTDLEAAPAGEGLHRLQGRAQFANELIVMVRDAPAILAKLKASQP